MNPEYYHLQNQAKLKFDCDQYQQSLYLWEKCLDLNAEDINNYAYIGLINLLQGDEQAAEIAWMSLIFSYDSSEIETLSQSLVNILLKQADYWFTGETEDSHKKAKILYQKLTNIDPDCFDSYFGLGMLAFKNDNYQNAIDNLSQCIKIKPDFAQGYYLRGINYQKSGNYDDAIQDWQKALELNEVYFEAYECLINCLLSQGKKEKVFTIVKSLEQKYSQKAEVYMYLGIYYHGQNDREQTLINFKKGLEINTLPNLNVQLVCVLEEYNNDGQKLTITEYQLINSILEIALTKNIVKLSTVCGTIINNKTEKTVNDYIYLIKIALLENNLQKMLKIGYESIKKHPERVDLYCELAYWLERNNQISEADSILQQALLLDKDKCDYTLMTNYLAGKIAYRLHKKDLAIEYLSKSTNINPESPKDKITVIDSLFELGFILDKEKQYQRAFNYFCQMKKLKQAEYQIKEKERIKLREYLQYIEAQCQVNWSQTWQDNSLVLNYAKNCHDLQSNSKPQPVFLVGFSRSGTTLLGNILDNHSDIYCLDEYGGIDRVRSRIKFLIMQKHNFNYLSDKNSRIQELKWLLNDSFSSIKQLREFYFEVMTSQLKYLWGENLTLNNRKVLIDKNPFDLINLTTIHRLFPEAKFICLIRHPLDVCLSSFMQNFQVHDLTANFFNLEETAKTYDQMMNVWLKTTAMLPVSVLTVFYENLIDDFPNTLKQILHFLQLDWDENLSNHYQPSQGKRFVITPSYRQINQPLNKKAKYRWHNYEQEIQSIKPILESWIKRFNYT